MQERDTAVPFLSPSWTCSLTEKTPSIPPLGLSSLIIYKYTADGSKGLFQVNGSHRLVRASVPKAKRNSDGPTREETPGAPDMESRGLYYGEDLTSFFRRLSFTPDGSLLITPAGYQHVPGAEASSGSGGSTDHCAHVFSRGRFHQ